MVIAIVSTDGEVLDDLLALWLYTFRRTALYSMWLYYKTTGLWRFFFILLWFLALLKCKNPRNFCAFDVKTNAAMKLH